MGYEDEKEEILRNYWTLYGPAWDDFLRQRRATVMRMASEALVELGPRSDHYVGLTSAGERVAGRFRAA